MSPGDFLLLALLLVALYALAAARLGGRPRAPAGTPAEGTRWNRFRVELEPLRRGARGALVVAQEPAGLRLELRGGSLAELPLELGEAGKSPCVRIERRLFSWRRALIVRFEGRQWLALRPAATLAFPELQEFSSHPRPAAPPAGEIELEGSLACREYEVRAGGALLALVSRQEVDPAASPAEGRYYLEVLKSVPPLPFAALVVALELAAPQAAAPCAASEGETEKDRPAPAGGAGSPEA
jgi:hypothetical protein